MHSVAGPSTKRSDNDETVLPCVEKQNQNLATRGIGCRICTCMCIGFGAYLCYVGHSLGYSLASVVVDVFKYGGCQ